ncbi:Putative Bzip transcription factor [Rhizopus microsporus]|nr:Putative Bzip transcription factor [Rhizopus microsporus]
MSYISQLNLLDDSPSLIPEEQLREELALWANAQFTFDMQPGSEAAIEKPRTSYELYAPIAPAPTVTNNKVINTTVIVPTKTTKKQQPKRTAKELDAIEEDKRKRNTAASARFRLKKKLKEQALEQTAKEMTLKAKQLEERVQELEREAKWLRALVLEKDPSLLINL